MFDLLADVVERLGAPDATANDATATNADGDSGEEPGGPIGGDGGLVGDIIGLERAKAMIEARVMLLTAELADRMDGWLDPRDVVIAAPLDGDSLAAAELAPALHLAPVTAGLRVERAVRLRDRLPCTLARLADGVLDLGRVLAIDDATRPLTAEAAGRVERLVVPGAVNQTAGELRAALRRTVIAVDPDGAGRRRQAAVKGRGVRRYARDDGTAAIEAVLSAVDTGEVYDLIDEVARRTKTTDDTRSLDARRADAFVRLVLGRDPLLGPENPDDADDPHSPDVPQGPDVAQVADGPPSSDDPRGPNEAADLDERFPSEPADSDAVPDPPLRGGWDAEGRRGDSEVDEVSWSQWPDARELAGREAALNHFDRAKAARGARLSELAALALSAMTTRRPARLRWVAINTVVHRDGATVRVGELEGYGPITRQAAEHLLAAGAAATPLRPSGREPTPEQAARHDPPDWLDEETRARDGTCRYPGCRQTARRGDLDHTVAFPRGPTVAANLGALCRRHHRVKHSGAWHVTQDAAHNYTWTSRSTGRTYRTTPEGPPATGEAPARGSDDDGRRTPLTAWRSRNERERARCLQAL